MYAVFDINKLQSLFDDYLTYTTNKELEEVIDENFYYIEINVKNTTKKDLKFDFNIDARFIDGISFHKKEKYNQNIIEYDFIADKNSYSVSKYAIFFKHLKELHNFCRDNKELLFKRGFSSFV